MFTLNKNEMLLLAVLVLFSCISNVQAQPKAVGEPVPGAEVYIELEPDDEPIANVTANEYGEFAIAFANNSIPNIENLPSLGTFVFTIKPTKNFAIKNKIDISKMEKVRVKFNKSKDGKLKKGKLIFVYELRWEPPIKAQNRGSFAVSGKSDA